ncbi:hypothetical protein [Nitrogeniibacter aestuarii]|uniref:hypothetical protein n=1 Tax=Nitrogeniibacter aestuarii TaxID=2815343 RepID=UPI001D10C4DE|nr:hypothetical protein [Nitrogeniibacter aestuarii]
MTALRLVFALLACLLMPSLAGAQDLTFRGCTDASGRAVPSRVDESLPEVVTTVVEQGRFTLLYNPRALPGISDPARAFLYAHECARHNLGLAREARTVENAKQADCWGLSTLQRSGLLRGEGDVAALQSELVFTPDQWQRIPGPNRGFELASCSLQAKPAFSPEPGWDMCVHKCGDRLFHCGQSQSCLNTYDACVAGCGR